MNDISPVARKFVLHWGQMGSRWGINRTVAQIHALLYISPNPLNAEQIAETLSIARSNVSSSLKELQGWGVVRVVPQLADRRDYFESIQDVWEMFRTVLDERKKREIDPTVALLRDCMAELQRGDSSQGVTRERIGRMLEFFETMSAWYENVRRLPTKSVIKFVGLGEKLRRWIGEAA